MTEEDYERKMKIYNIIYRLSVINMRINDLNSSMTGVEYTLKNNLQVNDQAYKQSTITSCKSTLSSASNSISNYIIPSLQSSLYY